jgi:AcrR family transcriptional regulator
MIDTEVKSETRQHILKAALKRFAHSGYAATSVQQIVNDAKVSKPTLYYYFKDKEALFQALVNEAHDERYRLMREAAAGAPDLQSQLTAMLAALFEYFRKNRELMRISFATLFAAPGEVPEGLRYADKCERNFEFMRSLMEEAVQRGEVNGDFDSMELTLGFYGQTHMYLMGHLIMPDWRPDHRTAAQISHLFLAGAAAPGKRKTRRN